MEVDLKVIAVDRRLVELQTKESYKILLKEQDDPTRLLVENFCHLKIQEFHQAVIFKDLARPHSNSPNPDMVTVSQRK